MQIVLLLMFSICVSSAVVFGTQLFLPSKRNSLRNVLLFLGGVVICLAASVVIDCVIRAGRPNFYYHTHRPGRATLMVFGSACLCGGSFYALLLMAAERKKQKKSISRWLVRSFLIAVCGAVLLEGGYFNLRHYELIGSKAPYKKYSGDRIYCDGMYFNRASWKFIPNRWNADPEFFVYADFAKIRNVTFSFDAETPVEQVEVKFDDRAHRRAESIGKHRFIPEIPRSYTIPLHTVGGTNIMSLAVRDDRETWKDGLKLTEVVLNQTVPLELDPVRFGLCFLALFLISAFFPGSPLWQLPLDLKSFPQLAAVIGLLGLVILFFVWTVFSSYTGSGLPIKDQKAALNENYQQYDKLVDALMSHRYALLETPHHYLEKDGDPYDMKLREERQYDYPWDTAYYQGNYYVYFGAVPAVTVLLPYKLLTGENVPLDYPILGFSVLFLIGLYGVYSQIVKLCFPKISFGMYWSGSFLLMTCLNLTWCLRRTLVYELAIVSGICFAVWGLFFMLKAMTGCKWKPVCCFLSGSGAALAVGCRPTMLFVSLPLVVLAFFALKADHGMKRLQNVVLFLLPYALVGAALMKYNYERFEDPFEFGITYQLTTENRAARLPLLGPYGRLLSILSSLFTLPKVDMVFPFVHPQQPELPYNGLILNSDTLAGVFSYPVMFSLILLPSVRRIMKRKGAFLLPFCAVCLVAALGICVTASAYAVTNRYLTDYLFLCALPAVLTLFCIREGMTTAVGEKAVALGILLCGVAGTAVFVSLSLTGEGDWFHLINPLYYDKLRYALSPWL